ncbi:UDP-glucosyltransferase 2-like [Colias croceus]|uniref:UDP-glucosyltransferase 2-like n=1 Tax=Colias crocea TaxID=72248 RepID=UPI001E2801BF|nr:UDP-glucosyltransferase 2-like [Colias croceus]
MLQVLLLLCAADVFNSAQSARILAFFPAPSISHQVVFRPLTQELVKRGHEVVVITPDPAFPKGKAPANLTEIDVHDISYAFADKFLAKDRGKKEDFYTQFAALMEVFPAIFEAQLQVPEVNRIITEERHAFDLLIVESCVRAALGLSHIIKAPMIQISSLGVTGLQYALAGTPIQPFLYPTSMQQRIYNLSLFEKIRQTYDLMYLMYNIYRTQHLDYAIAKKYFGDDMPIFEILFSNTKILFINEHPFWADNRPVAPNVIYIGGIHQTKDKPLPNDLKAYLDSSKNGVIYVSFGTNVKPHMLAMDKIKIMVDVLSKMPYDVLWKWDANELPGISKNIKISKWFPQSDLLKHPKIKLFITQGGLQSTDEAISAGVPLIGIPLLADQWYNVEKYVFHKIGLHQDYSSITAEGFKNALDTILHNSSYKTNIVRLGGLMREHPVKPLDTAVFWTEHVIKHGGDHLQPPNAGISGIIAYCEFPLVFSVLLILISATALIAITLSYIWKLFKGKAVSIR